MWKIPERYSNLQLPGDKPRCYPLGSGKINYCTLAIKYDITLNLALVNTAVNLGSPLTAESNLLTVHSISGIWSPIKVQYRNL